MLLTNNLLFTCLIQLTDSEHISAALNVVSAALNVVSAAMNVVSAALNVVSARRMQIQCHKWQPQQPFNIAHMQENR